MIYNSDFGRIPISEAVPEKYRPVYPNSPELEQALEKIHTLGGNVGNTIRTSNSDVAAMELVRRPDFNECGVQCGWLVYLAIPFAGSYFHQVAEEPMEQ